MVATSFQRIDEIKHKFEEVRMSNSENIINELISSLDIQGLRKAGPDMKTRSEINGGPSELLSNIECNSGLNNQIYTSVSNCSNLSPKLSTATIGTEVFKSKHQDYIPPAQGYNQSTEINGSMNSLQNSGNSSPLDFIFNSQRHQVPFPLTLPPPILPTKIPPRATHYNSARHNSYMPRGRPMMPPSTNVPVMPLPNTMQPPPAIHRYAAMPVKETKCSVNRWPAQQLNQPPPLLPTSAVVSSKNSKIKISNSSEDVNIKLNDSKSDLNNNSSKVQSSDKLLRDEKIEILMENKDSFGLRALATSICLSATVKDKKPPYSPPRFPSACSIFDTSLNLDEGCKVRDSKGKRTSIMDLDELGFNAYFVRNFEPVHNHIESPFTNRVISPLAASCELLPEEYNVSRRIDNDKLPAIDPELRYTPTDKLFLFFYLAVGEALQLKAANQLFNRGWRYIKTAGIWIARIKDRQLDFRSATCESGTYQFFNVQTWKREHGQFTLPYEDLAEDPTIADVVGNNVQPTKVLEKANQVVGQGRLVSGPAVAPPNRSSSNNDVGSRVVGSLPYQNQLNNGYQQNNAQFVSPLVNTTQVPSRRPILKEQQANFDKNTQIHIQEAMMKMINNQYRSAPAIKASYF